MSCSLIRKDIVKKLISLLLCQIKHQQNCCRYLQANSEIYNEVENIWTSLNTLEKEEQTWKTT